MDRLTDDDVEWLGKFINCSAFGPLASEITRALTIYSQMRTALRPDSSAVREAAAKLAESGIGEPSREYIGIDQEDARLIKDDEARDIANAIRNLPLPTLPAAEGWVADARRYRWLRSSDDAIPLMAEKGAKRFPSRELDERIDAALPPAPSGGGK